MCQNQTSEYMYMYMYMCMCVCMYMYIHVHNYVYACTHVCVQSSNVRMGSVLTCSKVHLLINAEYMSTYTYKITLYIILYTCTWSDPRLPSRYSVIGNVQCVQCTCTYMYEEVMTCVSLYLSALATIFHLMRVRLAVAFRRLVLH